MCGKLPHVETLSSPDNYSFSLYIKVENSLPPDRVSSSLSLREAQCMNSNLLSLSLREAQCMNSNLLSPNLGRGISKIYEAQSANFQFGREWG